jgi:hypothetical protein
MTEMTQNAVLTIPDNDPETESNPAGLLTTINSPDLVQRMGQRLSEVYDVSPRQSR